MRRLTLRPPSSLPAVVVLVAWLSVMAAGLLPDGAAALRVQQLALTAVTTSAAVVTLSAARRAGPARGAWLLLGLGLAGYAGGFVVQFWITAGEHGGPGGLNLSDCFSLLLYPCADAGLLLLSRGRGRTSILEGGIVLAGATATVLAAAAAAYPSLLHGSVLHIVYALAYPVGGFTLLVVTLTGVSMTGGRLDPVWRLLLVGFGIMTVGDVLYGWAAVTGRFHYGTYLDPMYVAGPVFVALAAAGAPRLRTATTRRWQGSSLLPGLATLVSVVVLTEGSYHMVPRLAIWSAAGCVVLAVVRTAQLFATGRALERSREQAHTDELTGLANRRALIEAVGETARAVPPSVEHPLELLLLDLDGFKDVNDSLGHSAGDELLVVLAEQLVAAAPGCLVARLGGDEFAVLLPRMRADAAGPRGPRVAARLLAAVGSPVLIVTSRLVMGASTGHAVLSSWDVPGEGVAPLVGELLRRADVALYRAKQRRGTCVSWDPTLDQGVRSRVELLAEFRLALLADDQLQAWFQPKADPQTGMVVGYEALARWEHPTRGLLLPGAFLDAVHGAGLLPDLTLRVLTQSLALLRELLASGRHLHVAVNLGAQDLLDVDMSGTVGRLLERYGVPAGHLRFEITESVVMSDPERILATLRSLRTLGVGLSLDDYGTGLSSLGYLRLLPVDELKIDRSFVTDLLTDPSCAVIVASTITLAHDLHMTVVAEGVEDQATLEALRVAGCDTIQGWHTGRPQPVAVVRAGLRVPSPRPCGVPA